MLGGDDSAAYAVNWRVVLTADALVGVAAALAGVAAFFFWNIGVGAALVIVGVAYMVLVGVRARRWSRLRRAGPS
jgi:hypothetical protein